MLESCAIAYLKEFFIAFMLFLIPILPYDANSLIFTFKMKSPTPKNLPRKFTFEKVRKDRYCQEEHSQVANQDPTGFRQRALLATRKII